MGPRARRRLVIGGIAALTIIGGITALLVTRSGSPNRSGNEKQTPTEVYGTFGAFGVSYGKTARDLVAQLGVPDRKRHGCWTYRINGGSFNGIKLLPQIAGMDAVRYCFYSGVVATIEDHWRPGTGDPSPNPWIPPLQFGCGGQPCHAPQ